MSQVSQGSTAASQWRHCSACKGPIGLGATYWVCSVSTCNRKRTGLVFCTVSCWEVHLPIARHRDAWAEEEIAPMKPAPAAANTVASIIRKPLKRISPARSEPTPEADVPKEVLVIGSRLKAYIKARYGLNASDRMFDPLSDIVRQACDEAVRNATHDERQTVLERDVPKPRS
jgi:hypothetical protein